METATELFLERNELAGRAERALYYATHYADCNAENIHWIVDQMVRALTGCPLTDSGEQGVSEEYTTTIADAEQGTTFKWYEGVKPLHDVTTDTTEEVTIDRLSEIRDHVTTIENPLARLHYFRALPKHERDAYLRQVSDELADYYEENPDALA